MGLVYNLRKLLRITIARPGVIHHFMYDRGLGMGRMASGPSVPGG
jgi:hypothetical protein